MGMSEQYAFDELQHARAALTYAERTLEAVISRHYAVGKSVTWEINGQRQSGTVLGLGVFSKRLRVRNAKTNAERWIDRADIVAPAKPTKAAVAGEPVR